MVSSTATVCRNARPAIDGILPAVPTVATAGHRRGMLPFYEHRMGYRRQEVVFRKVLDARG
jgi:hypothetical protein